MKHVLAALLAAGSVSWAHAEWVRFPADGVELSAWWQLPAGEGPFSAVVMLHGCSGATLGNGRLTSLYASWADRLVAAGYAVLAVDSFGPRGEREICTQKDRRISPAEDRPKDAHAAKRWLASRPHVDSARIHLMGWSNGATSLLHAVGGRWAPEARPRFRSAIAFYPGCAPLARLGYQPTVPLLILAGAADDWTPAHHCERMVAKAAEAGAEARIVTFPGAHHAFDAPQGEVRYRPHVRNASAPGGWGATVGPHPEAREKAIGLALAFLSSAR